jgi:hypothetical protein
MLIPLLIAWAEFLHLRAVTRVICLWRLSL